MAEFNSTILWDQSSKLCKLKKKVSKKSGSFKTNSLLDGIKESYKENEVEVMTDDGLQSFYLIKTKYKTNTFNDF